jgi:hypothetical protein
MAPKTTSSTLVVGDYKYIFLNRPDTQHIDFIRFKSPDGDVQTGKVGTSERQIFTNEGPIDTLVFPNRSLRLYYIGITGNNDNVVREIKLDNADSDDTDPTKAWTWSDTSDKDLIFETKVPRNTRLVDTSSFLAVTMRNGQPALSYKSNNQDMIQYVYYNGTKFLSTTLELPNQ